MFKRLIAAISALLMIMSVSACSIKESNGSETVKTSATTVRETKVHNNFKDILPKFKFDNEISEDYEESIKYSFNVKCSEKVCKNYIKQLKKVGFVERAVETESYYTAFTEDGYFVEMTYINGNLTVYTKKVS